MSDHPSWNSVIAPQIQVVKQLGFVTDVKILSRNAAFETIGAGYEVMVYCCVPDDASHYPGLEYRQHLKLQDDYPVSAPGFRYASIFYHIQIDVAGYPEPLFEDALEWGEANKSLADFVTFAHKFVVDGAEEAPDLSLEDVEHIWKHHQCSCGLFPVAYSPDLANKEEELIALRNRLNEFNKKKQQNLENVTSQKVMTSKIFRRERGEQFVFKDQGRYWGAGRLAQSFIDAVADGSEQAIRSIIKEEAMGIYSFDLFTPEFCDLFAAELSAFETSGLPINRPNSMNNYGCIVNDIGMESAFDALLENYLRAVTAVLFPKSGGRSLDHHHTFVVHYSTDSDMKLDMHEDSSQVTINVNIRDQFSGAGLTFCGVRGTSDHRYKKLSYQHVKGRCAMHLGKQRHGADEITSGVRENLIIWALSSAVLEGEEEEEEFPVGDKDPDHPDVICLSSTHDSDYQLHIQARKTAAAVAQDGHAH